MNKKLVSVIVIALFFFSVVVIPQIAYCQTATPSDEEPTPTTTADQEGSLDLLLIGGIIAAVVVVGAIVAFVFIKKKKVNEKSLRKYSAPDFQDWVIKRFNGKPSDPSSGIDGYTQGGQPLLIKQSDVTLAEVSDFVNALSKGKAQKGTIIAFNFDKDTIEGRVDALDRGIELQMLRVAELVNKRYFDKIKNIAISQVTYEAQSPSNITEAPIAMAQTQTLNEREPNLFPRDGLKPLIFISHSNSKITEQVKRMLEFLHYDYVMGDKEETAVPISDSKFGIMKDCDCAIINIAAAEQERRYSGIYILNSNVLSEIDAAYLKYNTQVVLLVERKVELPSNLKGLKRINYDSDDLSFNAAMDLDKALANFKKLI